MLQPRQRRALREVLQLLHRRDEAFGLLPAVDRGPPRGLIEAACEAVDASDPLPDLRQLPENVYYAARAAQLLAQDALTRPELDRWLVRNRRAAAEGFRLERSELLPLPGCRTHEDVHNRVLVGIEDLSVSHLGAILDTAQGSEGPGLTLVEQPVREG